MTFILYQVTESFDPKLDSTRVVIIMTLTRTIAY